MQPLLEVTGEEAQHLCCLLLSILVNHREHNFEAEIEVIGKQISCPPHLVQRLLMIYRTSLQLRLLIEGV
jgi:hypothetical protein